MTASRSRYWKDLTTKDFAGIDAERTIAVLPVGAVEQHGPHLPVWADSAINCGIVSQAVPLIPDGSARTATLLTSTPTHAGSLS